MARISDAARAGADIERLHAFMLAQAGKAVAARSVKAIMEAVDLLARHPQIGRPAEEGLRELVISYAKTGYLALYRFDPIADHVRVLAIRHQREMGY